MRWLFVLLALVVGASQVRAQTIGLFFDPDAAHCSGPIASGTTGRIYILVLTGGPASGGFAGYEFRVVGLPAGWIANAVRNPASNVQIGDPFSSVGVAGAFPVCQPGPVVLLFTVDLIATTSVTDHYLRVAQRNPSTNPNFRCPAVTLCVFPTYPIVCTSGGEAIVNPTGPGCTVAVQPTNWSRVKSLYERP